MAIVITVFVISFFNLFSLNASPPPLCNDTILEPHKLEKLHRRGYLEAYLIEKDNHSCSLKKNKKIKFFIHSIKIDGNKELFPSLRKKANLSWKQYQKLLLKIIHTYENQGYPFVRIHPSLDSLVNHKAYVQLIVKTGNFYKIDSILQMPSFSLPNIFLHQWLQIHPGEPYNEKKISRIHEKMALNPWIMQTNLPQIKFKNETATLYIFIKKKKNNSIQGIVGFTRDAQNKWALSGQGNLNLINLLNLGEELTFQWSSINKSQFLNLHAEVPFLLNINIGTGTSLMLNKVDTFYVKMSQRYDLFRYVYPHRISLYYQNQQFIPLTSSMGGGSLIQSKHYLGGISASFVHLNDIDFPKQGWKAQVDFNSGIRKIIPFSNDTGMVKKNNLLNLFLQTQFYVKVKPYLILFSQTSYRNMYSSSSIVQNEGILLGGLTTLRGFDENSLVWKSYILETIETHLFFDKEGYFSIFSDYCSGMQWTSNSWKNKNYLSFGFGIVFKAKSGIFQLYYALGKSIPGNFNFIRGKIHAGYSVKF